MFFPEDINVTKKGINIPWHVFLNLSNSNKATFSSPKAKKKISKPKPATQLKKNVKAKATSILKDVELGKETNNFPDLFSKPSTSQPVMLFPELIFPNSDSSNSIAPESPKQNFPTSDSSKSNAPESSENNLASFEHFLQNIFPKTISSEQNDLLQKTIDIVESDQPSLEIFQNCGTSSTLEHSDCPSQPKKIATAIEQFSDAIFRFQQNLNTEFNKFQNDIKNVAKTFESQ
jgi:hypothetical protein